MAGDAWAAGNLFSSVAFNPAFAATDLNGLANGSSVLSSIAPFDNGTALDQYMDISVELTIASTSIAAGANIGIWLAMLQLNGITIGDGTLGAGTQAAILPVWCPIASIPLLAATDTTLIGGERAILLPPRHFALILQNDSGAALASSGNVCSISTYNEALPANSSPRLDFSRPGNSQYLGVIS